MEQSILKSIKKLLGIGAEYTPFDLDVMIHINSAFATLQELGVGPEEGFVIEDDSATWNAFLDTDNRLNSVKTYVYLRVRLLFDPPSTSFLLDAYKNQIIELEWRLNTIREGDSWQEPVDI